MAGWSRVQGKSRGALEVMPKSELASAYEAKHGKGSATGMLKPALIAAILRETGGDARADHPRGTEHVEPAPAGAHA